MDLGKIGVKSKRSKPKSKKPVVEEPATVLKEEDLTEDEIKIRKMMEGKKALKEMDKKSAQRVQNNNEIHYYVCLVFQSWSQKIAFLEACHDVLAVDDVFVDGESFAKRFNVPVPHEEHAIIHSNLNKRLVALAKIKNHESKRSTLLKKEVSFG